MEITFRASLSATVVHGEPQSAASEHLKRRYLIIAHRECAGDHFTYADALKRKTGQASFIEID
jgi:hypothetical protein